MSNDQSNNMDYDMSPQYGEDLRVVSYCPVCSRQFNHLQAKIVDEKEGAQLVYIKCRHCYSSVLAMVMANQAGGVSSVGLITDLDSHEVSKFKQSRAITSDDVLDLHETLSKRNVWDIF